MMRQTGTKHQDKQQLILPKWFMPGKAQFLCSVFIMSCRNIFRSYYNTSITLYFFSSYTTDVSNVCSFIDL